MTRADTIFRHTCMDILDLGVTSKTRAKWILDDGSKIDAYTKHIFGVVNEYNLQDGCEFPLLTLRKTNWEKALDEILWIYQKKSNNVNDLNSHIWDSWADETGSIGKAYGYQCGVKYEYPDIGLTMDQVDRVLYDLKHDPASRRIMVNMWNPADLKDMHLAPCAYSLTFNVTGEYLNAILNQRSQDMLTASNWNVVQYSLLLMIIAQVTGFKAGKLIHVISDCHIYDKHIPIVEELLDKEDQVFNKKPLIIGKDVIINPYLTDFYDAKIEDVQIRNYKPLEFNYKIPVAV